MDEKSKECEKCPYEFFELTDEKDFKSIKISGRCCNCYNKLQKTDEEIEDQNYELLQQQDDNFLK